MKEERHVISPVKCFLCNLAQDGRRRKSGFVVWRKMCYNTLRSDKTRQTSRYGGIIWAAFLA